MDFINLPKDFPFRIVTVKPWAVSFKVPKYIVRIEIDRENKIGTYGWQVRYRQRTKFFSDAKKDVRKSVYESLQDAIKYLGEIYKGESVQVKSEPSKRKKNPINDVGIRLVERKKKNRNITEFYVEVGCISKGGAPKRFYVGTINTKTEDKLQEKLMEARAYRKNLVSDHINKRNCRVG